MSQKLPAKSYTPAGFAPSLPRTGTEGGLVFRGQNLFLRGKGGYYYAECYGGSLDLTEDIATVALTGILSFDPTSHVVTGVGTQFVSEGHLGQLILAGDELLAIDEITDATHLVTTRIPTTTAIGVTGYRLPRLFDLNKTRGTLLSGNALEFDQGTILFVGSGVFRVNGSQLPINVGNWNAGPLAKIAIFDPTNNWYNVYALGMNPAGTISATNIAGGVKGMAAGKYSIRVVPAKSQAGWNNPIDSRADVTVTAGQKVQITFNAAMDTGAGQDAWRIYVTALDVAAAQSAGVTTTLYETGPWYYYQTVTATQLGGTGSGTTWDIEWLSGEVDQGTILEFDNDTPLDAEFVTGAPAGYPVYVSVQGKGTTSKMGGTAPGPSILPTRPNNIESTPLTGLVPSSPPETIIGFSEAAGRLYLLTPNRLLIGVFTANAAFPITLRPFWKVGFKNANSLAFVNDYLYGFTTNGMTRSIATGDEGSESNDFAVEVTELTRTWNAGMVTVAYDQQNDSVCFFHSADHLNDAGFWTTTVLAYSLQLGEWHDGLFLLSSDTGDMIVSGVATVNGKLQFLAGGRQDIGGTTVRTYTWDTPFDGVSVPWYLAWQLDNGGSENRDKTVRSALVTAKLTNGTADIYTFGAADEINVADIESGANSASGPIVLDDSAGVTEYARVQLLCPNANMFTPRIAGTWDGVGIRDRVDELVLEASISGVRR